MSNKLKISIAINIILLSAFLILIFVLVQLKILPAFTTTYTEEPLQFHVDEFKVDSFATNLEVPWAIAHLDEDTQLVTERPGRVRLIEKGELLEKPILELKVANVGENGLMGITKDPEFKNNNYVYLYHSYEDEGGIKLKVVRYTFKDNSLTEEFIVLEDIVSGVIHSGGEIAFGPDGKLYITAGEAAKPDLAQDMNSLAGKILRINPDNSVPLDNPFVDLIDGKIPVGFENDWLIFSYGHRNPQGIDWHPVTHEMYSSEHGPSGTDGGVGMDEINLIRRGLNYGWPNIRGNETDPNMESPLISYTPAIAPSSILFYDGEMFPELQNKLLIATLRGTSIKVLEVDGSEINPLGNLIGDEYGRIRDLSIAPDGSIFFTTSNRDNRGEVLENDDHIYRISR